MWLSVGLGVVTLVTAYLGYHYSVPHEVSRTKRWLLRVAFISLSTVSLVLIAIQGTSRRSAEQEAKVSQDRLNATIDRLGTQTGEIQRNENEIKRVQGLNTELQNKLLGQSGQLLDSSKQISELSKEAIKYNHWRRKLLLYVRGHIILSSLAIW